MKQIHINRKANRKIRHKRTTRRFKIDGQFSVYRLVVSKTNKHLFAQIIDDEKGNTLVSSSTVQFKKAGNITNAKLIGEDIAKKAIAKNILKVKFDRAGSKYHGQIKAVADAARENGLKF
jgi:large subunit ribosomal protein L18